MRTVGDVAVIQVPDGGFEGLRLRRSPETRSSLSVGPLPDGLWPGRRDIEEELGDLLHDGWIVATFVDSWSHSQSWPYSVRWRDGDDRDDPVPPGTRRRRLPGRRPRDGDRHRPHRGLCLPRLRLTRSGIWWVGAATVPSERREAMALSADCGPCRRQRSSLTIRKQRSFAGPGCARGTDHAGDT